MHNADVLILTTILILCHQCACQGDEPDIQTNRQAPMGGELNANPEFADSDPEANYAQLRLSTGGNRPAVGRDSNNEAMESPKGENEPPTTGYENEFQEPPSRPRQGRLHVTHGLRRETSRRVIPSPATISASFPSLSEGTTRHHGPIRRLRQRHLRPRREFRIQIALERRQLNPLL